MTEITTLAELDELPTDTPITDVEDDTWRKLPDGRWKLAGSRAVTGLRAQRVLDLYAPLTLADQAQDEPGNATVETSRRAIDLMPQLREILGLPAALDLPPLSRIYFEAGANDPGWTIEAHLRGTGSFLDQWEALKAWAPGVEPELSDPATTSLYSSGSWRKATVTVRIAELTVTVWAHLDAEFEPPRPESADVVDGEAGEAPCEHEPSPIAPSICRRGCGTPLPVGAELTYADPAVRAAIAGGSA